MVSLSSHSVRVYTIIVTSDMPVPSPIVYVDMQESYEAGTFRQQENK